MGALTVDELRVALAAHAEIAVWREGFRDLCSRVSADLGRMTRVHVKLDSGMGRLGERDPDALIELARACADDQRLDLAGVWTHFATADEEGDAFIAEQLAAFVPVAEAVRELAPGLHRARRQQRRHASRPRHPLRHGPLRDRRLWAGPVPA